MQLPSAKSRFVAAALLGMIHTGLFVGTAGAQTALFEPTPSQDARLKELVRTGITEYRRKNYAAARQALLEAIQISPESLAIGTLADVEMKLKLYREAAEHWTIYLGSIGPEQNADRAEATAELETCRSHLAAVVVTAQPPDAQVQVDGRDATLAPTHGELWLEPGSHTFQVKSNAGASDEQTIILRVGERSELDLVARQRAVVPKPPLAVSQKSELTASNNALAAAEGTSSTKTYVVIGGAALTIIAAGIGVTFRVLNESAKSDADAATQAIDRQTSDRGICSSSNPLPACSDLNSANSRMKGSADIGEVAFVAAGVFAAATIGTYLLWPKHAGTERQNSLLVAPYWSPERQGIAARFAF